MSKFGSSATQITAKRVERKKSSMMMSSTEWKRKVKENSYNFLMAIMNSHSITVMEKSPKKTKKTLTLMIHNSTCPHREMTTFNMKKEKIWTNQRKMTSRVTVRMNWDIKKMLCLSKNTNSQMMICQTVNSIQGPSPIQGLKVMDLNFLLVRIIQYCTD
jgi:hypothetical protein